MNYSLKDFYKLSVRLDEIFSNNKKITLYGFGEIGEFIYDFYKDSITQIVDKRWESLSKDKNIDISSVDTLKNCTTPILVSSVGYEDEIKKFLTKTMNIDENKIFFIDDLLKKSTLRSYQQVALELIYKHKDSNHKKVLEVGGYPTDDDSIAKRLSKDNLDVTLINLKINTDYLRLDNIKYLEMDARNTSFEDNSFDIIYATAVVEHLNNLGAFLKEMYRILKTDGLIVLHGAPVWSSHHGHHVFRKIDSSFYSFLDNNPIPNWGHLYFSPIEMKEYLVSKDIPSHHADAICEGIYKSDNLNRLTYDEIVDTIKKSDFKLIELVSLLSKIPSSDVLKLSSTASRYYGLHVVLKK